jgi:activator of HSP90 ATPase
MPKTIQQTVTFKAPPHEVYEALMDSSKHSKFTGSEASISRDVGGEFSVFGGGLSGTNLELMPDKKIVQSWRATAEGWPEDHYSTVTFTLEEVEDSTRLTLIHTEVPDEAYDSISEGWGKYYWTPMKTAFGW